MTNYFYTQFPLFGLLIVCLVSFKRIQTDSNSFSQTYNKLAADEKKRYDSGKIKKIAKLWVVSIAVITILKLIIGYFIPELNLLVVFAILYVLDIIVYFLISHTRWTLNLFCRYGS